ncbi:GntR family transcriptional regulator [Streptomyces sp. PSKA54]|uniref:GntR family transcriptional regulator n=1 Tax=Streptomyces himalayensis subsp. aureolus TaxID=2758039 RepID=A0A7W2D226_9ACTN|nr:GntR family transcriptional regulator [Streptomyces himalayensis]MBA4863035.1 GntR family transcriptional regulator [Streptomyces himalayensis subsp. aureolus]
MSSNDFADTRKTATTPVVPRRALRDGVYDAILEKLLDGSTPPGSSLGIDPLARELGVSPTPVREALVQLEHTGLVSRVALKGYRVAQPLSPRQMAELIDTRSILEVAAAERAAVHAVDLVPELRAAHAQHVLSAHRVRKLRGEGGHPTGFADLREYFAADWEFHLTIIRAADNRFLLQLAESLGAHVHRLRQTVDHGTMDVDQAVEEHAEILAAFESGDPRRPVEAMRRHLSALAGRATAESSESP